MQKFRVVFLFTVKIYDGITQRKINGNKEYESLEKVHREVESKADSTGDDGKENGPNEIYHMPCLLLVSLVIYLVKESDQTKEMSSYFEWCISIHKFMFQ